MNYLLITISVASAIFVSASLYFRPPSDKKQHSEAITDPKNNAQQAVKNSKNTNIVSLKHPVFTTTKPKKIEFISTDTKKLKSKNTEQHKLIVHLEEQNKRLNQENKIAKQHAKNQDKYIAGLINKETQLELAKQSLKNSDVHKIKSLIEAQPDLITTNIKKQPDPQQKNKKGIASNPTSPKTKVPSNWDNLTGLVAFGFDYDQDNTVTNGVNGRFLLTYAKPLTYKLNSDYDFKYENIDHESTIHKSRWQLQIDRNLTPISTLFARTDLNRSHFASYEKEDIYSLGYGRTLINNSKHNLLIEIGPGYRASLPNIGEDAVVVDEAIGRLKLDYQYIASDALQLTFNSVTEIGRKNNIYTNDLQIQNKIYQKLFLALEFEYKYTENVPIDTLSDAYTSELKLLYAF